MKYEEGIRYDALSIIKGYIELVRPHNLVASFLTTMIGILAVYVFIKLNNLAVLHTQDLSLTTALAVTTVVLIAAGGYAINDYFDADIDAINKPYRPIPSGRVKRQYALIYSLTLMALGLVASSMLGLLTLIYALFNVLLLTLYSYRIKKLGIVGNITVSYLGAASIIFGALALCEHIGYINIVSTSFIPALFAFFLLLGREIIKTVEDVKADIKKHMKTLPILLGTKKALIISIAPLILVMLLSPLPILLYNYGMTYLVLALATDAVITYVVLLIIRTLRKEGVSDDEIISLASKLRAYLKGAIFLGVLAFLLDLIIKVVI